MGEESLALDEETTQMFIDRKKPANLDEELALFMHRFNLDIDTVETMPAFENHLKLSFPSREKK